jgi:hypothetical protein
VQNTAGVVMPADHVFDFFVLAGDVNRNRAVDGSDFAILAGNFGRTAMTFAQGDLTGDGRVDGADFAILAGNFGRQVPPPPAVAVALRAPQSQPPQRRGAPAPAAPAPISKARRRPPSDEPPA